MTEAKGVGPAPRRAPHVSGDAGRHILDVMSGSAAGPRAALLRAALGAAEPLYAAAMAARNGLYDSGAFRSRRLPRPVVSVGNVTAGGTGKTPVVRWLAERLRGEGRRVAVLSRGYKARPGSLGDEQVMLERLLNGGPGADAPRPDAPPVVIRANPSRFEAGTAALAEHPGLDVFLLDDGFQHRAVARDFDLVLVNATEPFGYGRVFPRGLLREPLRGLRRAHAFVLTRADQAGDAERRRVVETLRRHNPAAPIYEARHEHAGFRTPSAPAGSPGLGVEALRGRRYFAFSGIADPKSLDHQLRAHGGVPAGARWFPDHADYTPADVDPLRAAARSAGADVLVTTEKDWAKLAAFPAAADPATEPPIWRVDMRVRFLGEGDEERLLGQVRAALGRVG